ncbi:MAG: glutamate-cysteine ligase family protein [Melioribacteraceae bacterium]|nr:glutamate-cysteine ligase family protein [Melioribacteraceae bacterium]
MKKPIGLFEGFGVELEYMIANKDTLKINPITDEVIKAVVGQYVSDFEDEEIAWSNELVLHVIEIKTNGPAKTLNGLENKFYSHVKRLNSILENYNSVLMPSGAHPFFNPGTETKLWPHESNAVYESYNRIFNCSGHGWSNLQSIHINLPFANDAEFGRLHAAIRLLLPNHSGNCSKFTDFRQQLYRLSRFPLRSLS